MLKDKSIQQFLDELASQAPTPGGGSAAAIMGAMGAALVSMVCNLTVRKRDYGAVEGEMKEALEQAENLRTRLTELVRADIEAFDQVMGAYALAKDTDQQKQIRRLAIQEALKAATDIPLECAKACSEVIKLSQSVAEKGNRNALSDAGVAAAAGYAALRSAALNVYVNAGAIKDEAFVASRLDELKRVTAGMGELHEDVYRIVKDQL